MPIGQKTFDPFFMVLQDNIGSGLQTITKERHGHESSQIRRHFTGLG
jgi:hypothetical protein